MTSLHLTISSSGPLSSFVGSRSSLAAREAKKAANSNSNSRVTSLTARAAAAVPPPMAPAATQFWSPWTVSKVGWS